MAPGTFGAQSADVPSSGSANEPTAGGDHVEVAKDEVGWYFVEQYYTNLSRSPEKLHVSVAQSDPGSRWLSSWRRRRRRRDETETDAS